MKQNPSLGKAYTDAKTQDDEELLARNIRLSRPVSFKKT